MRSENRSRRWLGEELIEWQPRSLGDVPFVLPDFSRQPVKAMPQTDRANAAASKLSVEELAAEVESRLMFENRQGPFEGLLQHEYLDLVVREPGLGFPHAMPIATVSKQYVLILHKAVISSLIDALRTARFVEPEALNTIVSLSEYGGRMHVRIDLPKKYATPDNHPIVPTLHCWNSVDGTRPLEILIGWFRLVCENGMILGDALGQMRRRHVGSLNLGQVASEVTSELAKIPRQLEEMQQCAVQGVDDEAIVKWVDSSLSDAWGPNNAATVLHIIRKGMTVTFPRASKKGSHIPASQREVIADKPVPGSDPPNDNLYRVAQALTWLAERRGELESKVGRLFEVADLVRTLGNQTAVDKKCYSGPFNNAWDDGVRHSSN